MAFMTNTSV